ncbi:marine proteobacterial sortase target protein [Ostreibacterium oceani]|uniref:Marine proteobacterial sortase target protein n=1 Tax=Ostreibacterium oceani TaxID=2654998 RepID=A0A6N7ERD6_9GAMM|nr:marine proteobacterial sortase target protein [Ostreibacterium oceani]MPV85434.1 marine proteobacterial sortase target protein [Ostreibacterium oceani]
MQINRIFIRSTLLISSVIIQLTHAANNDNMTARLMLADQSNQFNQPALLLNTEISGEINGMIATMTLTQTFQNTSNEWMNGQYEFPLSDKATIDSLTMTTDNTVIRGIVKEKAQAKLAFEAAKDKGKKASLLTQSRPNLFTMSLANIAPNAEVITEITWITMVDYRNGQFSLRLPTTFTPRYSAQRLDTGAGDFAFATHMNETDTHQFSLNLHLALNLPIENIHSATHDIRVDSIGDSHQIELSNGTEPLNRDMVIHWEPMAGFKPSAAIASEQQDDAYYYAMMIMPPVKNIVSTLPKAVTFIIDTSGSMAGDSIQQAKRGLLAGLDSLSGQDVFNIVAFDSHATRLFDEAQTTNSHHMATARRFVNQLQADGGTEMLPALQLAFSQPENLGYLQQIIFITDGAVANEAQLFNYLSKHLGDGRLFTVGIGSAPNQHFMSGAAKYGRGSTINIANLNEVDTEMTALFDKISRPMMRDISIDLPFNDSVEIYPKKIPDLYTAEPILLTLKSANPIDVVRINGKLGDENWASEVNTDSPNSGQTKNIHKIWAKNKIADFNEQSVLYSLPLDDFKDDIIHIGIAHQIVTPFTAFVAIEEKISKPTNEMAKSETIANLAPKNSLLYAPSTATNATLQLLIGLLFLTLAMIYYFKNAEKQDKVAP